MPRPSLLGRGLIESRTSGTSCLLQPLLRCATQHYPLLFSHRPSRFNRPDYSSIPRSHLHQVLRYIARDNLLNLLTSYFALLINGPYTGASPTPPFLPPHTDQPFSSQTPLEKAHQVRAAKKAKKEETKKRRLEALRKARDAKKKAAK